MTQTDSSLHDPRQAPTPDFIADLRHRYATEAEIDRVLTRKMQARAGDAYKPVSFEQMVACLDTLLKRKLDKHFAVRNARWMTGGSSKLQMGFELEWHGMDGSSARHVTPMVLRMSPAESIVETSRRREFEIINALADLIPVPVCYWEDELMEVFPYPVLIFGFAEGVAKPASDNSQQVTSLGINYGSALRARVTDEFMSGLGTFHTADIARLNLDYFEVPTVGSNAGILKQVNMWRRVWDEDRGE